ncbi:MAG: hypothetical protein B6I30_03445 [Desulfobacteraceae bacterium 4572_187]|nr:MAG: hypothetical protein B6I30_03445 [Desulfobacteraceae bacterium 4572_187]
MKNLFLLNFNELKPKPYKLKLELLRHNLPFGLLSIATNLFLMSPLQNAPFCPIPAPAPWKG